MNPRQAVTFAILMGGDVLSKSPDYVKEKVDSCEAMFVPEVLLDADNRALFQSYANVWKQDWNTYRDLGRPLSELLAQNESD